jgi:hypothetical protein
MASHINDLPTTSPHGSDFGLHPQILGLASDLNVIRGTATAHCTCVATSHRLTGIPVRAAFSITNLIFEVVGILGGVLVVPALQLPIASLGSQCARPSALRT